MDQKRGPGVGSVLDPVTFKGKGNEDDSAQKIEKDWTIMQEKNKNVWNPETKGGKYYISPFFGLFQSPLFILKSFIKCPVIHFLSIYIEESGIKRLI